MNAADKDVKATVLVDLTLNLLFKGGEGEERFVLRPEGFDTLRSAIDATSSTSEARRSLEDLLKLARVLEQRNESPTVTMAILAAVSCSERALTVLGIPVGKRALAIKQKFARFRDETGQEVAPQYESDVPEGSVKLATLLEPGRARPADPIARSRSATKRRKVTIAT